MDSQLNYTYQTIEIGKLNVHIRSLKNLNQFSDTNDEADKCGINSTTWPIFGVLWKSSSVLATIMENKAIKGLNILEVGCGLGLSSIVLSLREANITATDYNPAVEGFLQENTRINKCNDLLFKRADWSDCENTLGEFDLIIGSDLLYERDHAYLLANFINIHAKKSCEVIIAGPNRGYQGSFTKLMEANDFDHKKSPEIFYDEQKNNLKVNVHFYQRNMV